MTEQDQNFACDASGRPTGNVPVNTDYSEFNPNKVGANLIHVFNFSANSNGAMGTFTP